MKNKKYHTVGNVLKFNRKIVGRNNFYTTNIQLWDIYCYGQGMDNSEP